MANTWTTVKAGISKLRRLGSPWAIPAWLLTFWKQVYAAINALSNLDFVRQHISGADVVSRWVIGHGYWITLVAGLAWLAWLVVRPEKARKRKLPEPTETITGKQYFHETVQLDGRRFEGCTFVGCRLEFHGTANCFFADDCVVREEFFIITLDPVSNAYINAWQALRKAAGPTVSFEGKQSQVTGEFSGPIAGYMKSKKGENG